MNTPRNDPDDDDACCLAAAACATVGTWIIWAAAASASLASVSRREIRATCPSSNIWEFSATALTASLVIPFAVCSCPDVFWRHSVAIGTTWTGLSLWGAIEVSRPCTVYHAMLEVRPLFLTSASAVCASAGYGLCLIYCKRQRRAQGRIRRRAVTNDSDDDDADWYATAL